MIATSLSERPAPSFEPIDPAKRMNQIYRNQRHIYNLTRKYFLLGRDRLIERMGPAANENVLEIGCGTGRNLIRAARRYPSVCFFGIDISTAMLASAATAIARSHLESRVTLASADAMNFDSLKLFGVARFERIFISYSLSMIPEWQAVARQAHSLLSACGELHILDFGDQIDFPDWFSVALRKWLALFEVVPRDELEAELTLLAWQTRSTLVFERPHNGYAQYAIVKRNR